jgi:ribonuclease BN (tRNA processing enzyme)
MQAMGYRANINGKTVAYTGDTMMCEDIFDLARDADVLVVDCTYAEGCGPEHMGLDDIKEIRARVRPETAIVLTHLNGQPVTNGLNNVITARDLATFKFD